MKVGGATMLDRHRELRESLGVYLLGDLDADARAGLEAHLSTCSTCPGDLLELEPVVRLLRQTDPARIRTAPAMPSAPPAGLESRVMDRIGMVRSQGGASAAQPPRPVPTSAAPGSYMTVAARPETELPRHEASPNAPISIERARERRGVRPIVLAAAAALAIFAVGVGTGWVAFRPPPGPPTEPVTFAAQPAGVDAGGKLIAHTWGTEASLVISGLSEGEVYRATFFTADGTAVDGGTFIGVSSRPIVCNLNAAVLRPQVVSLSITDAAGAEILRANLSPNA